MSSESHDSGKGDRYSLLDRVVLFSLNNKLVVVLLVAFLAIWGVRVAPFDWEFDWFPRSPVPVDAIPDIGENQQIVFTEWPGKSPKDIDDQIAYPLTLALRGIPGVQTVRSFSQFGFSSIYIIFSEETEFYWSRARILEKLNSLPSGTLPMGVSPALGPDATALGQVFWYTLEGRDLDGNPAGGWDLQELRTVQDWYVRYALLSAEGVSEAASVGGYVQEYQIDVDPDAMRANQVTLDDVFHAVHFSNVDVGARTIEVNRVEYIIRGIGFLKNLADLENTVVKVNDNVPVFIKNVANVGLGPALRRGALDKEGAEAVGGVVVARYGSNPLEVIKSTKAKIADIAPGLPSHVLIDHSAARDEIAAFAEMHGFEPYTGAALNHEAWVATLRAMNRSQWPDWANISQVTIVPFYDRTKLIYETLGTLNSALIEEILITIIVVLLMVAHLRSSLLISGVLPLAVLMCFIAMKQFGVDANVVALSGIAIAIGTMVDMGVIVCENILRKLDEAKGDASRLDVIYEATREVGGAVLTAVSTTVVGFLPVFTMTAAEGKLFKPLAYTKTFALVASLIVALLIIPPLAHLLFGRRRRTEKRKTNTMAAYLTGLVVAVVLARHWMPLGPERGVILNFLFVAAGLGVVLGGFYLVQRYYTRMLGWCLAHKFVYLSGTVLVLLTGATAWLGFDRLFAVIPAAADGIGIRAETVRNTRGWSFASVKFPGLGKEFMPALDEGSYLYMPTTMPHASIGEALEVVSFQDQAIAAIPEVGSVVGKIGRVDSPLDPAPISMIETVINYKPEYATDEAGHPIKYRYNKKESRFERDALGSLIPESRGRPYRQWRDHIRTEDDIWSEIVRAAEIPGTTSAPKLQPIATRIVMLQTGMRAPMGVKIQGPDLETIESVGLEIERFLKEVPTVEPAAVLADRIVGKPYIEIDINREAAARYGITIQQVQNVIEVAIGGRSITTTIEGRERYPVRVRYMRELRDDIESLDHILVPAAGGAQIPLVQLANIRYLRGPQAIKSEDTFLTGYVLFDMKSGHAEVDVVEDCRRYLESKVASGALTLPANVSYRFAGSYENQLRSTKTLAVVLPLALFIIFMILYFQFRSVATTSLVFSGIAIAWAGGFILIWLYAQPWFMNIDLAGVNMRELFQVQTVNLSVAIWVGFLALFGIASDNGVVIATYLDQSFAAQRPGTVDEIRRATIAGAERRIRPCLMTTATTLLALLPILTSTGRGSDIMVPMAIPSFGGMLVVLITIFLVPVLYALVKETRLSFGGSIGQLNLPEPPESN